MPSLVPAAVCKWVEMGTSPAAIASTGTLTVVRLLGEIDRGVGWVMWSLGVRWSGSRMSRTS